VSTARADDTGAHCVCVCASGPQDLAKGGAFEF